jgi:hypothetical protein
VSSDDVMLKLFNLKVPQKICSLGPGPSLSTPGIMPKFDLTDLVSADKVFCDIKEISISYSLSKGIRNSLAKIA